jgi:anti-sigma factor RsiW
MMTCGRARRLLWPDTGPREATPDVVEARAHVRQCEGCRRFFEDMRRMSERIRAAAPRPEAPAAVRDRLFKAIARARTGAADSHAGTTWWRRRLSVGVVAAVLFAGTWLTYRITQRRATAADDILSSIVQDHVQSQSASGLASGDSLEVARWLADRLPYTVQVPIFPEAQLKGTHLLLINRQSGAVIDYVVGGQSLSYYVIPTGHADTIRPREIRVTPRSGYRLAVWEDAGLTHALIAVLPEARLLALAQYCIQQMMVQLPGERRILAGSV